MTYPNVQLHVNGEWRAARSGKTINVLNPANEEVIGTVAHAEKADLDEALAAAEKGFAIWKKVSAYERSKLMRKAADLVRARADDIARLMTLEQGKPLGESKAEIMAAADIIDWFAEEARRAYGRVVPARAPDQRPCASVLRVHRPRPSSRSQSLSRQRPALHPNRAFRHGRRCRSLPHWPGSAH